jgi:thiol:disulfide interchange protein DsbC
MCLVDLLAMLFVTFSFIPNAMANSGCSHDCAKCHRITKEEVTKVLNANTPGGNVKVVEIKMSPVKGVWEIVARQGFKTGIFYLDFEKKHLIYGAIVGTRGEKNLTKASFEKNTRLKVSELKEGNTLLLGTKEAATKLYVFSDPTCSHCAEQHKILKQTVKERPDIAVHVVLFPLKDINPDSYSKAQTVYCAKSLKALEDSYAGKKVTASSCDLKAFTNNIAVGQKYGITGTPTTVFPNGTIYFGNLDQKTLLARLEATKR